MKKIHKLSQYNKMYEIPHSIKIPAWIKVIDSIFGKNFPDRIDVAGKLLKDGDSILDVGTGSGRLIFDYAQYKFNKLTAIDISSYSFNTIKSQCKKYKISNRLKLIEGDILDVDLLNHYDAVVALAFLEHVYSPFEYLKKFSEILKKNGQLIIEVPNVGYLPYRISMLFGNFPTTAGNSGCIPGVIDEHIHFYTFKSLNKILNYCGFKVIQSDSSGRFLFLRLWWKTLLCSGISINAIKIRDCPSKSPIIIDSSFYD